MSNDYYTQSSVGSTGATAKVGPINTQFAGVQAGFGKLPDLNRIQQGRVTWCGTAGGTANAITLSDPLSLTSFEDGAMLFFEAALENTGAATIDVNSIGAVPLVRSEGDALEAGDLHGGSRYMIIYDSGNARWRLLNDGVAQKGATGATGPAGETPVSDLKKSGLL